MTIKELHKSLESLKDITFKLSNGKLVPKHFHLTEIGLTTKQFIDCGGAIHTQKKANLQLWVSIDIHHRLKADKFQDIIDLSLPLFDGEDIEIEVEFETNTVGKYGLQFNGEYFELTNTKTDCLALDNCGIGGVMKKAKKSLKDLGKTTAEACCTPGGSCC